jgi:MerR family transcriptional regulator, light-induced transcriptional regulator
VDPDDEPGTLRIGELSRRVGVSDHLLRAWESRYGLLRPMRSAGGFRLYSANDEGRVRRMQFHLARGLSAAEAARATIGEESTTPTMRLVPASEGQSGIDIVKELSGELRRPFDNFDEPAAQHVLDRLLSELALATVLRDVVVPYLRELGERWDRGEVTIAQEHFASNVIRGRLAGLARSWGNGRGPLVVAACPPGELHDLPLMIFAIILNRSGWRVDYFGASTPVEELVTVANQVHPDLIVLAATTADRFTGILPALTPLADIAPLALAGAGATQRMADELGARLLTGDPVTAAENEVRART